MAASCTDICVTANRTAFYPGRCRRTTEVITHRLTRHCSGPLTRSTSPQFSSKCRDDATRESATTKRNSDIGSTAKTGGSTIITLAKAPVESATNEANMVCNGSDHQDYFDRMRDLQRDDGRERDL